MLADFILHRCCACSHSYLNKWVQQAGRAQTHCCALVLLNLCLLYYFCSLSCDIPRALGGRNCDTEVSFNVKHFMDTFNSPHFDKLWISVLTNAHCESFLKGTENYTMSVEKYLGGNSALCQFNTTTVRVCCPGHVSSPTLDYWPDLHQQTCICSCRGVLNPTRKHLTTHTAFKPLLHSWTNLPRGSLSWLTVFSDG